VRGTLILTAVNNSKAATKLLILSGELVYPSSILVFVDVSEFSHTGSSKKMDGI
jgi:hypothetical protein